MRSFSFISFILICFIQKPFKSTLLSHSEKPPTEFWARQCNSSEGKVIGKWEEEDNGMEYL